MASLIPEDLTVAGTHALVIGVSRYPHFADGSEPTPQGSAFQMEQLSAAARSASEFAAWLKLDYRREKLPLKSLRVLLSPSEGEQIAPAIQEILPADSAATRENVKRALYEFRRACDSHRENVAIVYVVGHGVQLSKNGAILLLSDFGAPGQLEELEGAVDMASVHDGMNHPATARTQFWFVDACRQKPDIARRFESLGGALTLDVPNGTTETSPMFLAATTGKTAYARVGGATLFNEALMWSLRGGAAAGPEDNVVNCWHVGVTSLIRRLPERVAALAREAQAEQSVDIAGKIHEATLHEFASAPKVDLQINLRPTEAHSLARATLKRDVEAVFEGASDWPIRRQVEAGLYWLDVSAEAPYKRCAMGLNVAPLVTSTEVKLSS